MKNVHLLATPNPSRLYYLGNSSELTLSKYTSLFRAFERSTQHLYITANGKFNRGDYVTDGIEVMKASPKLVDAQGLIDRREWKRIILTTDSALINERVQAIPEEFLKWYIKNQNCEKIETVEKSRCCGRCNGVDDLCFTDMTCALHQGRGCETCYGKRVEYSINLPKDEIMERFIQNAKQETLEEAIDKASLLEFPIKEWYRSDDYNREEITAARDGFKRGAKWQQEQDAKEIKLLREELAYEKRNKTSKL